MFSGIVEQMGVVRAVREEAGNKHFTMATPIAGELKIDQSISHNGVCLTVVALGKNGTHGDVPVDGGQSDAASDGKKLAADEYVVTAIAETLLKSNLGDLKPGDKVNLERSMRPEALLDGHIVQGHVDQTARCTAVDEADGSWYYTFEYDQQGDNVTVEKGSVAVNGVSLTVVNSRPGCFQVAIIPFTHEHTNFHTIKKGSVVNLEFDIIGKYIARLMQNYR